MDRAITQYTFFGNSGTNLHKNGTWYIFQLANIANRFLCFLFQARYTNWKYISEGARESYFFD